MSQLPSGWMTVPLGELLSGIQAGSSFKCDERTPARDEVGVVKVSAVTWGEYNELESKTCTDDRRVDSSLFIRTGDFLFSRANTIELVGACVIAGATQLRVMLSDKILRLSFARNEMKHWVLQFLRSKEGRKQIETLASGNQESMRNIGQERLRQIEVPVPPAAEQARIVTKLEELLSDLDAGVAELKAAQKKLQQYRQSLLKDAVEGALTAPWREAQRKLGTLTETGAQLLQRILTERRARWEAKQLAKFKEQGKAPPKDWQKKYPEPVQPDTTDLPELPEGWVWASLAQLVSDLTSGSRDWAPFYDRGTNVFVMAQNVRPWRPDFSFKQFVDPPPDHRDRARSEICVDDLLVTIVGANTGQVCRVDQPVQSHFVCQSVALLRLVKPDTAEFVNAVLNSEGHGQRQFREMNYGAGRPHLSFDQLESVLVPLPPMREQTLIMTVLAEAMMGCEQVVSDLSQLARHATAQRQNILRAAFAGQLVPQDPNDEPASVLLERVRAERDSRATQQKPRARQARAPA